MALYPTVKALVESDLPTNVSQLITALKHRGVEHQIIDDVGASQVLVNPAIDLDPGTPQNPVAYIALPGVYENFINSLAAACEVTAPLGVLKWDGTSWEVTQLPFPTADNYFKCKTTATYTQGTNLASIAIEMMDGGITALNGQWVKITSRRTGRFDFVQLIADVGASDTSISIDNRVIQYTIEEGSIVDFNPVVGMRWWVTTLYGNGADTFVDMPSTWRPPPVEATSANLYHQLFNVIVNRQYAAYATPPVNPFDYGLNAVTRTRMTFAQIMEPQDEIIIKLWQPCDLSISS